MPEAPGTIHAQYSMELADASTTERKQVTPVAEGSNMPPVPKFQSSGWPEDHPNIHGDPNPPRVCL